MYFYNAFFVIFIYNLTMYRVRVREIDINFHNVSLI